MISKEKYQKTLIRMWDSVRDNCKGEPDCSGVSCSRCPLSEKVCSLEYGRSFTVFEAIETVEQWGKEHPTVTRLDKLKEAFPNTDGDICPSRITGRCKATEEHRRLVCDECKREYWSGEYESN